MAGDPADDGAVDHARPVSANGTALRKRKIRELVGVLAEDAKLLLQQEVELAKAELAERAETLRTDLGQDVSQAKEELSANAARMAAGAAAFAVAAMFGLVALGLLAAMLTRLLDHAMSFGAALTIAFAIYVLVALVAALVGRSRMKAATPLVMPWTAQSIQADVKHAVSGNPVEQTVETVKEDVEWLKHPTRSEAK